ncbi:phosphonate C-P lyase system protein PhnG [Neotabrizicola shimadae]|uniref:Phosphonate C-P lyase system protein PhnG n=1 Tax=Neotabrizicola shimadae TaxID=2807096 RepID=A0A8G1EAZ5_9RHOB|nr:phosphonate C-P lyase system protein PhnG [Neotabrizicola shimadae]QYZ69115.1 phosphonate C-P lyase system protein PhnG [Neotabrizicola shimadae]
MTDHALLTDRRAWMGLLARARPEDLARLMPADLPDHHLLRGPEIGTVLVRGRIGGTGGPFNLGEMTVTRCTVRLADGIVGHAVVQGRDKTHAHHAAVLDALMQTAGAEAFEGSVLRPLSRVEADRRDALARRAAATRVEFFTMVRGEDE